MAKRKKRQTRVTRQNVEEIRAEKKVKANKRKAAPGPWTEFQTKLDVKAKLKSRQGIIGESCGTYTDQRFSPITEKGWYPVLFNVTSRSIQRDVDKFGIDEYLAACERSLNNDENKKKYGTIILIGMLLDHSNHEDRDHRFISCTAKTNKKSISGFAATRKEGYIVLP